jgi:hypothetical protein
MGFGVLLSFRVFVSGLFETPSESQMEIHPLGESHVLDVDQPYPCSDPTGLHLEQTEQVDLADLVLRPIDLLEGLENRRAIGRDRGPRGFGIRCRRPGGRDLTAPLS